MDKWEVQSSSTFFQFFTLSSMGVITYLPVWTFSLLHFTRIKVHCKLLEIVNFKSGLRKWLSLTYVCICSDDNTKIIKQIEDARGWICFIVTKTLQEKYMFWRTNFQRPYDKWSLMNRTWSHSKSCIKEYLSLMYIYSKKKDCPMIDLFLFSTTYWPNIYNITFLLILSCLSKRHYGGKEIIFNICICQHFIHLILTITQWRRHYYLCFIGEETES